MEKVVKFLKENPVQFLATIGLDGKPKVRPFQFMLEKEGKLYFCTSNKKSVFKELEKNSYIELTVAAKDFSWLRLSGKVIFENNLDLKNKIVESNNLVKSIYHTGDNPNFEIFYLEKGKAEISDFSGKLPYIIKF